MACRLTQNELVVVRKGCDKRTLARSPLGQIGEAKEDQAASGGKRMSLSSAFLCRNSVWSDFKVAIKPSRQSIPGLDFRLHVKFGSSAFAARTYQMPGHAGRSVDLLRLPPLLSHLSLTDSERRCAIPITEALHDDRAIDCGTETLTVCEMSENALAEGRWMQAKSRPPVQTVVRSNFVLVGWISARD